MAEVRNSIRTKLIRLIMLISGISLLTGLAVLLTFEIIAYKEAAKSELEVVAKMLAQNLTAALAFENEEEAEDLISSLRVQANMSAASVFKADGSVFVESTFNDGKGKNITSRYFDITVPIVQGDKTLGSLFIRRSTSDVTYRVLLYVVFTVGVMVLCFGLTYYLSRKFERTISTPIIELASVAKIVSQNHDYSKRVETPAPGEIDSLRIAFNDMLSKIEAQNSEIQEHTRDLELKVDVRTQEIKRQRDFAETVVSSSLVLIAVFDTDLRVAEFNKRCEIEFRMRKEDIIGRNWIEAMPAIVGSPAHQAVLRALGGESVHFPKYQSPVSGEYYESYAIPLKNEKGEVYAVLLTAHNITALVTATDSLVLKNEELKKKNADLEQFAYVASHDLQEPLRKIQVFADFAERLTEKEARSLPYVQKIMSSAERMSTLIKDVLQYSRLSNLEKSFDYVNLNQVVLYVRSDFELLLIEKSASLISAELPIVWGNQLQLHQLFSNLINNAIKFNERTPEVKIACEQLKPLEITALNLDKNTVYFKILFSDNGIGFDPRYKDQIFSIFQRLHTRDKFQGTGIGLALCKRIVENHGGRIDVSSQVGEGTTFSVVLPATAPVT